MNHRQPGEPNDLDTGMAPNCAVEGDVSAPVPLGSIRGKLTQGAPLDKHVWFRSGGKADWLFEPADLNDLKAFCEQLDGQIPIMALGVGSNMIIRDGGVPGVVIKLGPSRLLMCEVTGETTLSKPEPRRPARQGRSAAPRSAGIDGHDIPEWHSRLGRRRLQDEWRVLRARDMRRAGRLRRDPAQWRVRHAHQCGPAIFVSPFSTARRRRSG